MQSQDKFSNLELHKPCVKEYAVVQMYRKNFYFIKSKTFAFRIILIQNRKIEKVCYCTLHEKC